MDDPVSWEVKFTESTVELLRQGWTADRLTALVENVADAEEIFYDGDENNPLTEGTQ